MFSLIFPHAFITYVIECQAALTWLKVSHVTSTKHTKERKIFWDWPFPMRFIATVIILIIILFTMTSLRRLCWLAEIKMINTGNILRSRSSSLFPRRNKHVLKWATFWINKYITMERSNKINNCVTSCLKRNLNIKNTKHKDPLIKHVNTYNTKCRRIQRNYYAL